MSKRKLNKIKAVLAEKGITSIELANTLGKNRVSVSRWCRNESQPSLENIFEIAKILNVSAKELIFDEPQA